MHLVCISEHYASCHQNVCKGFNAYVKQLLSFLGQLHFLRELFFN